MPQSPILSPFEKAIFPWFASLDGKWKPTPGDMTDAEEKAMGRLLLGGFIEARIEVTITPISGGQPLVGIWRVSGPFSRSFEKQILDFASGRGLSAKDARISRKNKSLRLTSEGERAKADFHGQHEFEKPEGSTTGMPKHLFDIISGGDDGSRGCMGNLVVVLESEPTSQKRQHSSSEEAIDLIRQFIAAADEWIAIDNGHSQFCDRYMDPHIPGLARQLKGNIDRTSFFEMNKNFHEQKDALRKPVTSLTSTMVELAKSYGIPGGAFLLSNLKEARASATRLLDAVVAEPQNRPGADVELDRTLDKEDAASKANLTAGLMAKLDSESINASVSGRKGEEHHTEEYETGWFGIRTKAKGKRVFKGTLEERAERTRKSRRVTEV